MTKEEYIEYHQAFCQDMVEVTKKKNHDYSGAGGDPFANFRQIGNLIGDMAGNAQGTGPIDVVAIGFLTRMSDKFSRIGSFVSKGKLLVENESVEDTLKDLANYCALFSGYLAEKSQALRDAQGIESEMTKDQAQN